MITLFVWTIIVGLLLGAGPGRHPSQIPSQNDGVSMELPLCFVSNRGQTDPSVAYYLKGSDRTLYFTASGITFALRDVAAPTGSPVRWIVKFEFSGADPSASPTGEEPGPAAMSYFIGNPETWITKVETFRKIVYQDLWPGIDLVYSCEGSRLKYSYIVEPGADPSRIRLACKGADVVRRDESGRLICETPMGVVADDPPSVFQIIDNELVEVAASYDLDRPAAGGQVSWGFDVGSFDPNWPLIIDPSMLIYCGYIGGEGTDAGHGIAVDRDGHAYIAGYTYSDELSFPVVTGPDLSWNGSTDVFVAKVDPSGSHLVYCGYIGGQEMEGHLAGIAVDAEGCACVVGQTASDETTFPVFKGPDLTHNGGTMDVFVARLNRSGTALEYCGYIGGRRWEEGYDIAVDQCGSIFVVGYTLSDESSFPVTRGPDLTFNGSRDVFIAKVDPSGIALDYCGYIGGTSDDNGLCVSVDGSGRAFVGGSTASCEASFPVRRGPDLTHSGGWDAFVARVHASGKKLDYCGFIGGTGVFESACGIAVDHDGGAVVAGGTNSDEGSFPVRAGPDLSYNGGSSDAFIARVHPSGKALDYCGYLGGCLADSAMDAAVDGDGNAYIAGYTDSDEMSFPLSVGPDLTFNGETDVFLARVDSSGSVLDCCGYVGGRDVDYPGAIAVDLEGGIFLTGYTGSDDRTFPVLVGPDRSFNASGLFDAFVARIPPLHILLRSGNVNKGSGDPADVVLVNDSAGEIACRKVTLMPGGSATITVVTPPSGPDPASFVLYCWPGEAGSSDVTRQPFDIGTACFPMPLSTGSGHPPPVTIVNNIGWPSLLGFPVLPHVPPAPCKVGTFRLKPGIYTIQGLILDAGSPGAPCRLTNAVMIEQM